MWFGNFKTLFWIIIEWKKVNQNGDYRWRRNVWQREQALKILWCSSDAIYTLKYTPSKNKKEKK